MTVMMTNIRFALATMSLTALFACVQVPGSNAPQEGGTSTPSIPSTNHPPKIVIKFNPDYIARIMAEKAKPANSARILELANDNQQSTFALVGHGHNVAFDSAGFELSYIANASTSDSSPDLTSDKVSVRFEGARSGLKGTGQLPTASATHVLRKSRFIKDVPAFGAVRYEDVYPHIDLYYMDTNDQFTFMFVVQPGGDPSAIRISVEGDDGTIINSDGALIVSKRGKTMSISAPFTYQETPSGKKSVESEFSKSSDNFALTDTNTFQVGIEGYSNDSALIIDPTVDFVSMLGNGNNTRLTTNDSGDIFIAGPSADFAPNAGVFYIARYNGKTGVLLNQTLLFSGRGDMVRDIYAKDGKLYATGYASADLLDLSNTNPPAIQTERSGATDAFVLVMDETSLEPTYGTYFGGSQRDYGIGIRADEDGNILFAGYTESVNFPLRQTTKTGFDAFAVKIKPTTGGLNDVVFANTNGGSLVENINDVGLDAEGNFYMVGRTSSSDLPRINSLPVTYQQTTAGFNPFLWKVSPTGTSLFSTYAHSHDISTGSYSTGMDVSQDGHTIAFGGSVIGSENQMQGYIMKISRPSANDNYEALYSHIPPGLGAIVHDVALDSAGNIYAAGEARDAFLVTVASDGVSGISAFLYVLKDVNEGPEVAFSKRFGGQGTDRASAVLVDRNSHGILVAGSTNSATFTGIPGRTLINGSERGFLMSIDAVIARETPDPNDNSEEPGENPELENHAPVAKIIRTGSSMIRAAKLSIVPNAINLGSIGDWILAFVSKDISALAKIKLDASESTDADSDQLTYRMIMTGPNGTSETSTPMHEYNLHPGSYDITLTVCDPYNACSTTTDAFTVSRVDFSKVNPQDLKLNGVAADWSLHFGGDITAKFSKNLFKPTVSAGQNVPVVLSGALEGVDYIRVIDD